VTAADATILSDFTEVRSHDEANGMVVEPTLCDEQVPFTQVIERFRKPEMPRRAGRYEIVTRLGGGGMAQVYLARAASSLKKRSAFERVVAVKVLHPHLAADAGFVEMFLHEARIAAVARHANIVSILDVGLSDEMIYSVMDYVEGDTLSAVQATAASLGRGVPLPMTLRIVLDALAGLHAAHELRDDNGIDLRLVHRDVTPQNILIGVDGAARLTDFGIARARGRAAETCHGTLKGKLAYMPPEQIEAAALDRRADLFAMGVTLWETVALRRLFPGRTTYEFARQNARVPYRPLSEIYRGIPPMLDVICARALAHNPSERYATAEEFSEDLESHFGRALATPREVGAFISAVAREKIEREHEALRTSSSRGFKESNDDASRPSPPRRSKPVSRTVTENPADTVVEPIARGGLGAGADASMLAPIPLLPRKPRAIVHVATVSDAKAQNVVVEQPTEIQASSLMVVSSATRSRGRSTARKNFVQNIAVVLAFAFGVVVAVIAVVGLH
jgi:eukaryotic-like serine/threonine-protein kinase